MLIYGLGQAIQADREREIQERMRHRGLLMDALEAVVTGGLQVASTEPQSTGSIGDRAAGVRSSGSLVRGRSR